MVHASFLAHTRHSHYQIILVLIFTGDKEGKTYGSISPTWGICSNQIVGECFQ